MKALAIDSATNKLTVAAKNDDKIYISTYDVGMHQSKTLIPAIDYVLKQVEITTSDLDYTAVTLGPGSFTGLRIALSALKAIQLANKDKVPVYGISTIKAYAYPFIQENFQFNGLEIPVLSCLDAKKDRFYAGLYSDGKQISSDGDYEVSEIAELIKNYKTIFIAGDDAEILKQQLIPLCKKTNLVTIAAYPSTAPSLFAIAEEMIKNGEKALEDYDGPVYLRASEAEIKINEK